MRSSTNAHQAAFLFLLSVLIILSIAQRPPKSSISWSDWDDNATTIAAYRVFKGPPFRVEDPNTPRPAHCPTSEEVEKWGLRKDYILYANETQTATIIFLHDYMQTGDSWIWDMDKMRQPYMKVICPTAKNIPNSMFKGLKFAAWFNFYDRVPPHKYNDHEGLLRSTKIVHDFLDKEIKNGTPPHRIIVAGESHGALLAIHAALSYPKKLAGIAIITSWMPQKITADHFVPTNRDIPVFQAHFVEDDFPLEKLSSNYTHRFLRQFTNNITFLTYPDLPMSTPQEYEDLKNFFKKILYPI